MDQDDVSPNPNAPPMSRLLPQLAFKMLDRTRSDSFDMIHGAMPPLQLGMLEKESLVAYLESLER